MKPGCSIATLAGVAMILLAWQIFGPPALDPISKRIEELAWPICDAMVERAQNASDRGLTSQILTSRDRVNMQQFCMERERAKLRRRKPECLLTDSAIELVRKRNPDFCLDADAREERAPPASTVSQPINTAATQTTVRGRTIKIGDTADQVFSILTAQDLERQDTRQISTGLSVIKYYRVDRRRIAIELARMNDPGPYVVIAIWGDLD